MKYFVQKLTSCMQNFTIIFRLPLRAEADYPETMTSPYTQTKDQQPIRRNLGSPEAENKNLSALMILNICQRTYSNAVYVKFQIGANKLKTKFFYCNV